MSPLTDLTVDLTQGQVVSAHAIAVGMRVSFTWSDGLSADGTGVVIQDMHDGHVLVAVDSGTAEGRHFVIWCDKNWLGVIG